MLLEGLPAYKGHMVINFSAQASSNSLQVRDGALGEWGGGGRTRLMCCLGNLADQLFGTQSSNHLKQQFTVAVEILTRGKLG